VERATNWCERRYAGSAEGRVSAQRRQCRPAKRVLKNRSPLRRRQKPAPRCGERATSSRGLGKRKGLPPLRNKKAIASGRQKEKAFQGKRHQRGKRTPLTYNVQSSSRALEKKKEGEGEHYLSKTASHSGALPGGVRGKESEKTVEPARSFL